MSLGSYAATLLTRALANGAPPDDVVKRIEEFNSSPAGKYSMLDYDKKQNKVESIGILQGVDIVKDKTKK